MSKTLAGKIFEFLTSSSLEHITAFSIVYQAMEEDPWIQRDILRNTVINAVNLATDSYSNDIMAQNKILTVSAQTLPVGLPIQCDILDSTLKITRLLWKTELLPMRRPRRDGNFFDIAFEGVCSLRDIEVAKEVEQINNEQIKNNMREMKRKLKGKSSPLAIEIYNYLDNVEVDNLGWWDPLASQVISDDSDLVLNLPRNVYHNFMEPLRRMKIEAPSSIKEICYAFVEGFDKDEPEILQQKWHLDSYLNGTSPTIANLKFAHSYTMLMIFTSMGLLKEERPLTADFTLEEIKKVKKTEFVALHWGSTFYLEVYTCPEGKASIRAVLNYKPLLIPGCESEYCDWKTFKHIFRHLIGCDFWKLCAYP
ncbi:4827_t:CDS:2 [Entrophospora sp. SA101]|nr:4827_t:CDS:2 [Entrophospora sp. SA101]